MQLINIKQVQHVRENIGALRVDHTDTVIHADILMVSTNVSLVSLFFHEESHILTP